MIIFQAIYLLELTNFKFNNDLRPIEDSKKNDLEINKKFTSHLSSHSNSRTPLSRINRSLPPSSYLSNGGRGSGGGGGG